MLTALARRRKDVIIPGPPERGKTAGNLHEVFHERIYGAF